MRTLLRDGRIHSPEAPDGSALVIEDGRIAWIGDDDVAAGLADAVDAVVDLAGALVTPAFVDSRVHMTDTGLQLLSLDLSGARSLRDALDALERDARASRGRPVLARGWDASSWPEGRGPTPAELDRAAYGGIAYALHADGLSAAASTPVLRAARVQPGSDGLVTGADLAAAAQAAKAMLLPSSREAAQRAALEAAASAGIGSVHEFAGPGDTGAGDLSSLLAAAADLGGVRVLAYWAQLGGIEAARALGAIGVADNAGDDGPAVGVEERAEHLLACAAAGMQSALDAGAPGALDSILDSFALAAQRTAPISLHGAVHRLERAWAIDDPSRLSARGLLLSAQPGRAGDLAAVSAAGVPLALGSDAPFGRAFDPWGALQAAVYGTGTDAAAGRSARGISPRAAFTAHTRGGWRAARGEHDGSGVIRAGAPAHLAIWAAGGLGMDAVDARVSRWSTDEQANLPGLPELQPGVELPRCLRTVVDGRIAFDAGELG